MGLNWSGKVLRMIFTSAVLISCLILSVPALAQETDTEEEIKTDEIILDEITAILDTPVVTATRTETLLSKTTKSISVISRNDMEDAQEYFLPEMIDNVPGVFLKRSGGPGGICKISMRGAEGRYTQLQYNGIPLKDTADVQSTFQSFIQDFYNGTGIDRVEVLRGTNSTLYGSQAMGGVINIIPDKWNKELNLELRSEFGENRTFIESARLAYGQENYYMNLNPAYYDTNGMNNDGEYDYYYETLDISAGAGVKFGKGFSLEFSSLSFSNEGAMSSITPGLDANLELVKNQAAGNQRHENRFWQTGIFLNHDVSAFWDYSVKGAYSESRRRYFWSDVSGDQSDYEGDTTYLEMQHNIYPADWLTLTLGVDYEKSAYDNKEPLNAMASVYDPVYYGHEWEVWDGFCKLQLAFLEKSLLFDAGVRYNAPQEFDSELVWEASAAYIFEKTGTKIHGHMGTGYRTPALYEIYGGYLFMGDFVTVGNPDLQPEESTSYEVGIDQFFMGKKINTGLTYFGTDFDNLVVYDLFASRYNNASDAKARGVEAYLYVKPSKYFRLGIAYTYTDSEYKSNMTGEWIQSEHLPENKANVTASFYPAENLTAYCRVTWIDEKIVPLYDTNFSQVRWEEDSVTTVDAALTYKISEHADIWVRGENLLNEEYSEGGWTMPGRWLYGGVRVRF